MKPSEDASKRKFSRIQIQRPSVGREENERLWSEVRKYARLIPSEAEPNLGRVQEIREEIKNGTYLTPEVLEETAARLTIRFMTRG